MYDDYSTLFIKLFSYYYLKGAAGIVGSQMPLGGPPLSASNQAIISDWIVQGALFSITAAPVTAAPAPVTASPIVGQVCCVERMALLDNIIDYRNYLHYYIHRFV